ncbi:MAG: alpha/beta fold hydrolase [Planctomycetota bacterium]
MSEATPVPNRPSLLFPGLATLFASGLLRASRLPGRKYIGSHFRKKFGSSGAVSFKAVSEDDTVLDCWFSPAPPTPPALPLGSAEPNAVLADRPRLPIFMAHGWFEMKELHFARAHAFNALGHDVVLFDHRSHGRSTGSHATFGVQERRDLEAVITRAGQDNGGLKLIDTDRVITVGFSLGAATVLQHAAGNPRVTGTVAIAPYSDFRTAIESFRRMFAPWMSQRWLTGGFERASQNAGFEIDDASTLRAMQRIGCPVMLVEGMKDRNLPPKHHTRPLAAAKTQGPVRVFTVQDASHINLCRKTWPGLDQAIAEFCAGLG